MVILLPPLADRSPLAAVCMDGWTNGSVSLGTPEAGDQHWWAADANVVGDYDDATAVIEDLEPVGTGAGATVSSAVNDAIDVAVVDDDNGGGGGGAVAGAFEEYSSSSDDAPDLAVGDI